MRHLVRDLLTLAAGVAAAALLVWAGLATRPNPATFLRGSVSSLQEFAGFAAAVAGIAVALWWCVALILAVLSAALQKAGHAAAAAAAGALAPAFMKRIAAAVIGLNLISGVGAAQAAAPLSPAGPSESISSPELPGSTVDPQWEPAAAAEQPGEPPTPHWKPREQSTENVFIRPGRSATAAQRVVREGDSLWSLAAEQLGPKASDADIAAHWPRWYERNRTVIGDRPALILPGQVLDIPQPPGAPGQ